MIAVPLRCPPSGGGITVLKRALFFVFPVLALGFLASCSDGGNGTTPPPPDGDRDARIVMAPASPTSVSDTLRFVARVTDPLRPVTDDLVTWVSDRDGVLGRGHPGADGRASITIPVLSRGEHEITLLVDFGSLPRECDRVALSHILPARVVIVGATVGADGVSLSWTASDEPTFARYEVRRYTGDGASGELIASRTDRATTTAVDSLPPLAEEVSYAVSVVIEGDLAAASRPVTVPRPNGPVLGFDPFDAAIHPTAPIVYILDRSFVRSRLVAVNYATKEVVGDRTFDCFLQYMDVAENGFGVEVYVSRYDDGISVLDALTLAEIVHVPMGLPTASVVADGLGHVFVSLGGNDPAEPPLRSYERGTWTQIGAGGTERWMRLERVPGKTELVGVAMASTPARLYHYLCDGDGRILAQHSASPPTGAYCSATILRVDPAGSRFYTHIWGSVYAADATLAHVGQLPHPAGTYRDFAHRADGAVVFVAHSLDAAALTLDPATLTPTGRIAMRGYPQKLFTDGAYLIGVSRPGMSAVSVCVDAIRIPAIP